MDIIIRAFSILVDGMLPSTGACSPDENPIRCCVLFVERAVGREWHFGYRVSALIRTVMVSFGHMYILCFMYIF